MLGRILSSVMSCSPPLRRAFLALALLSLGAIGCSKDEPPSAPPVETLMCKAPTPGPAPLRLLTRFQYDNAVRDLLGDTTHPATSFPPENEVDGYRTNAAANAAHPILVERYLDAAAAVATRAVTERLAELAPCAAGTDVAECGRALVTGFGARAFRRPLSEEESSALVRLFVASHPRGHAKATELVIRTVLQSPQFLYRVDTLAAPTPETGAVTLGAFELASRLAFSIWGSMPDAELFDAAANGRLATPADVEQQARRMVEDPRAAHLVRDFSEQWLGLSRLAGLGREGTAIASKQLEASLRDSLDRFIIAAYFGPGGGFQLLFSSPAVWADSNLAPLYGVPGDGTAPGDVSGTRFGLLTQPALMTLLAHPNQSAPIQRGVFVRERILCLPVDPPPPSVDTTPPDPDPNATTRERFRQHTEQSSCSSCHKLIDGIGFGFERYDQLGRFRSEENGLAVDESGAVIGSSEPGLDGPFTSSAELLARIANSQRARDCLATNWYRYSFGRLEQPEDACSLAQLKARFSRSGGDLKDLLVSLTQTDSFLYRPANPANVTPTEGP
jgi:hypothetical protein